MDAPTVIAFLGALGAGGAVAQLIHWVTGRKNQKADLTTILTSAAGDLVKPLRDEVNAARLEAQSARAAAAGAEDRARVAESRANSLSARFDRIWPVVEAAAIWEEAAFRVLIQDHRHWSDPPLRQVVGQGGD